MKEILINKCYGGFRLSNEVYKEMMKKQNKEVFVYVGKPYGKNVWLGYNILYTKQKDGERDGHAYNAILNKDFGETYLYEMDKENDDFNNAEIHFDFKNDRENKDLIEVIKRIKDKANTNFSELKIVEIPKEAFYRIEDYDGIEHIVWSMSEINETW